MADEKITLEFILEQLHKWVSEHHPISKETWLDSAQKLNILSQDLDETIANSKSDIADYKAELILKGSSAIQAKLIAESGDKARELRLKEALKLRVIEHIRIAKKRSELFEIAD